MCSHFANKIKIIRPAMEGYPNLYCNLHDIINIIIKKGIPKYPTYQHLEIYSQCYHV